MVQSTNGSALRITPVSADDTADLIRLFGALHRYNAELDPRFELADNWQELVAEYLEQSAGSDESMWYIARIEEYAVGFVLVEVHSEPPLYRHRCWAEIVGLYVEPDYRSRGIAEALMQRAYEWALQHKLPVMQLYVTASNKRAQRFYAREGFDTTQLVMRRVLSAEEQEAETPATYSAQRLHFSESGERPLDMHKRLHHDQPRGDTSNG